MKSVIHEHTLVCLSTAPSNANIIRTAAKMADAFGGTLTALYVQTKGSEQMGADDRMRLQQHIRLAEKLGAAIVTVTGDDVTYQIAEFARLSKVTKVVIGRSSAPKGHIWSKKPLTERLTEQAPYLDIYIIPDIAGKNIHQNNPAIREPLLPSWQNIAITVAILAVSTLIGFLFHRLHFTPANTITVYILGVLLTALFTRNHLCSGVFSLVSVLLFNFFFTEPRLSFQAYDSGYPVTFVIMLIASLITGTLANRLATSAKQSSVAAWRTKVLLETNQHLQKASDENEIFHVLAEQLFKLLSRPLVLYPAQDGQLLSPISFTPESFKAFSGEPKVANWAYHNHKNAGASTADHNAAQGLYLPIRSNGEPFGVVGINIDRRPLEPLENSILLSILGEGALTLESHRNAREKEEAAVLAKNEQLRSNLLRSISHDLRTPLTAISGNAENLLVSGASMDAPTKKAVLTDIYDDSIWLIQLVENLLAITKIGEGGTRLNLTTELVDEVISESLRHIRSRIGRHIIETELEDLLLVQMDARLISQVIINLVDNALKYTPDGSTIRIRAWKQNGSISVSVADNGPGITDNWKHKAFDLFFTGDTKVADCRRSMGLGLALCKSIITIHGGEIRLTDNMPTGCIFTFTLPASEVSLNE